MGALNSMPHHGSLCSELLWLNGLSMLTIPGDKTAAGTRPKQDGNLTENSVCKTLEKQEWLKEPLLCHNQSLLTLQSKRIQKGLLT